MLEDTGDQKGDQEHEPTRIETEDEVAQEEHEVSIIEGDGQVSDQEEHVLDDDDREQTVTRKQVDLSVSDTIVVGKQIEEPPVTIAAMATADDQNGDVEEAILTLIGELQSLKDHMNQSCQGALMVAKVIDRKIQQVIEACEQVMSDTSTDSTGK